ncbi:MAG: hypothetical protein AAFV29_13565, partial [Myxococcota bacterium]
ILDADRQPVRITPDTPLEVSIPDDADEGSTRFWLRYSGTVPGLWRGAESLGTGLRLTTNDPDNPTITVSILAASNAPNIDVIPDFFNFDGSVQGLTSTTTITVRNTGSAPLTIRGISLRSDSSEFEWAVASNETFPLTLDVLEALPVVIRYTPVDAGNDLAFVEIASDDPASDPIQVELRGGATPRIRVDPPDVLIFPAAPTSARDERVFVCNVGDAPLAITALNLVPVSEQSTSLDDFSVVSPDCAVLPCAVDLELCAPGTAGCSDSCENLTIRYANNDQSSVDEVNFVISSNDPGDPEHRLAFRANDVPCLFPRPEIRVVTPEPCAGRPVTVTAEGSDPGGRPGADDVIDVFEWEWLFAPRPIPVLTPVAGESVTFIPEQGGTYILGLTAQNSCGRASQMAATAQIPIRDSCE